MIYSLASYLSISRFHNGIDLKAATDRESIGRTPPCNGAASARKEKDLSPTFPPNHSAVWSLISTGDGLRGIWLDISTALRLAGAGVADVDWWTQYHVPSKGLARRSLHRSYLGTFVYCPACKRWDVAGVKRERCNLCSCSIDYVSSDRWRCEGSYLGKNGFPVKCYGRGRSPNFAGDECAFPGCGEATLKVAMRVKISLGFHRLTDISDTEYKRETCFVGDAQHTDSHEQKLERDRLKVRRRLTRGSVGSWRTRIGQKVTVVEPLMSLLTDMPEKLSGRVVVEEYDLKCDECGALVFYNELHEKQCSECGLLASNTSYRVQENFLNMATEDGEAQGDDDWKISERIRGSDKEKQEHITYWRSVRRSQEEKADGTNRTQYSRWREASKDEPEKEKKKTELQRTERHLRIDFIDLRVWTLMNGGPIEQASIPTLFESCYGAKITPRQAEEAVKRIAKAGRIEVEVIYDSRGKRIVINRLPIARSIANTRVSIIILKI